MKNIHKNLVLIALLSVVVAVILFYGLDYQNGIYLLALPFDLLGKGIRWLSLHSAAGNIGAFILYFGLSLFPMAILFVRRKKREKADWILLLITLYHFFFLYFLINPGVTAARFYPKGTEWDMVSVLRVMLTVFYISLWGGYVFLRLTETVFAPAVYQKSISMNRLLRKLLLISAYLYVVLFFYNNTVKMFHDTGAAIKAQADTGACVYPGIGYLLTGIPVVFTVLIFLYGARLLEAMETGHLKEDENKAAVRLGEAGRHCIYATVICNLISNILQLFMAKQLNNINLTADISFLPLITALFSMILSAYFKEAEELKENDELFI